MNNRTLFAFLIAVIAPTLSIQTAQAQNRCVFKSFELSNPPAGQAYNVNQRSNSLLDGVLASTVSSPIGASPSSATLRVRYAGADGQFITVDDVVNSVSLSSAVVSVHVLSRKLLAIHSWSGLPTVSRLEMREAGADGLLATSDDVTTQISNPSLTVSSAGRLETMFAWAEGNPAVAGLTQVTAFRFCDLSAPRSCFTPREVSVNGSAYQDIWNYVAGKVGGVEHVLASKWGTGSISLGLDASTLVPIASAPSFYNWSMIDSFGQYLIARNGNSIEVTLNTPTAISQPGQLIVQSPSGVASPEFDIASRASGLPWAALIPGYGNYIPVVSSTGTVIGGSATIRVAKTLSTPLSSQTTIVFPRTEQSPFGPVTLMPDRGVLFDGDTLVVPVKPSQFVAAPASPFTLDGRLIFRCS